ncbi:MAG: ABC transporter ATP-binding protein [Bacteroides sp.]|nr:ABC transporter ATP-binding protein [Bacteroides sp.]
MLEIKDLCKKYDKLPVLRGITLNYLPGKIHGLVGENGAGKTTLFRCILSLETYGGTICHTEDIRVGYLSVAPFFYPLITGMEYIEFCLKARRLSPDKAALASLNGLFHLPLERYVDEYSSGMKKKLVLLTLLLQDNDMYLLDEPFNGMDLSGFIHLKQIIGQLREKGKTVIFSSHLLPSLTEICDCIHYLHTRDVSSGSMKGCRYRRLKKIFSRISPRAHPDCKSELSYS